MSPLSYIQRHLEDGEGFAQRGLLSTGGGPPGRRVVVLVTVASTLTVRPCLRHPFRAANEAMERAGAGIVAVEPSASGGQRRFSSATGNYCYLLFL